MSTAPSGDGAGIPDPGIRPGEPVAIAPGVIRLTAPNAGMMTGPGTNTYVIGEGDVAVLDPGPDDEVHRTAILSLLAERVARCTHVVVTHTHSDHAPGAGPLARTTGAEVVGFDARASFEPTERAADGHVVEVGGATLRAIHTPGHASDHLCWLHERLGILFSGDHVMGGSTVVIAPPDGDMSAYLAALARLQALDPPVRAIAPGHGPVLSDPGGVLAQYVEHRMAREAAIAAALEARGTATLAELVDDVYVGLADQLRPVARYSVWAHLRKLGADGRATTADRDDVDAEWSAATTH